MNQQTRDLAGLQCVVAGCPTTAEMAVVLLHGFDMSPSDLAPFAHSLGIDGIFVFPRGPWPVGAQSWAWWQVDGERRSRDLARGPRDLSSHVPEGLDASRKMLSDLLAAVRAWSGFSSVALGGFSQGAMLACDHALVKASPLSGLILMSATRVAMPQWQSRLSNVERLPVFVSHGERDSDLSFEAGAALRDTLVEAGAVVTWVPFNQGHEIPLPVWRAVRKFLRSLPKSPRLPAAACA